VDLPMFHAAAATCPRPVSTLLPPSPASACHTSCAACLLLLLLATGLAAAAEGHPWVVDRHLEVAAGLSDPHFRITACTARQHGSAGNAALATSADHQSSTGSGVQPHEFIMLTDFIQSAHRVLVTVWPKLGLE